MFWRVHAWKRPFKVEMLWLHVVNEMDRYITEHLQSTSLNYIGYTVGRWVFWFVDRMSNDYFAFKWV